MPEQHGQHVRIARPERDGYRAIARLHYLSHTIAFREFASQEWLATRDLGEYERTWRDLMTNPSPGNVFWVARSLGEIVGMVRVSPAASLPAGAEARLSPSARRPLNFASLNSMHVHPDKRGAGIGRQLMAAATAHMESAGYTHAYLGVIEANTEARRFYEAAGWREESREPVGVEGVPICHYRLALA